jgi:hypothetical protein
MYESNSKRKVIRIPWEKYIFRKKDKWCISIYKLLHIEEQNVVDKGHKKNWFLLTRVNMTNL